MQSKLGVLVVRLQELEHVSGAAVLADGRRLSSLLISGLDAESNVDELAGALLEDEVGAVCAVCQIEFSDGISLVGLHECSEPVLSANQSQAVSSLLDQLTLRVAQQSVVQILLVNPLWLARCPGEVARRDADEEDNSGLATHLLLRRWLVLAEAVHVVPERGDLAVRVAVAARLVRASRCVRLGVSSNSGRWQLWLLSRMGDKCCAHVWAANAYPSSESGRVVRLRSDSEAPPITTHPGIKEQNNAPSPFRQRADVDVLLLVILQRNLRQRLAKLERALGVGSGLLLLLALLLALGISVRSLARARPG